jgi:peptidoglycan hydrolase-like protein with peptidoglycan-binding domain
MDLINKALETLNQKEEVVIAKEAGKEEDAKKEEEKKDDKKEDEKSYEEIKSGNVDKQNLTKKGKNLEAIKGYQEKINQLLGDKEKIKADGLYGKGTEAAVKAIASKFGSLVPDLKGLDGKSMTPGFLKFIDKYEKNKDKVAELFK